MTDANDAPVITSDGGIDTASVNVAENTTAVTTVTATDQDFDTLSFSLVGGADQSFFTIDQDTGDLAFISAPDFETPAGSDGNNYEVMVRASDGHGGTDDQTITVTVTDANDPPVAQDDSQTTDEDTALNAAVPAATDSDGTIDHYALDTDVAKGTLLLASDGTYSFDPTGAFDSLAVGDHEDVTFTYHAVDDGGAPSDPATVTITVTGVNDLPVISSNGGGDDAPINVAENTTIVTTVTVDDPDLDAPTFSLNGGEDQAKFTIDAATGVLAFIAAPDFENPSDVGGDNHYEVVVHASDGNGGTDDQTITVAVTDANDPPVITSNGGGTTAAVNVAENTTAVTTVTATDQDLETVTFGIVAGADKDLFTIDENTGALAFITAPDFEHPTDAGGDNHYEVVVQAVDVSGAPDQQTITVDVTNVSGTINGTAGKDVVNATTTVAGQPLPSDEEDTIDGKGGNDNLSGLGGDDTLLGGGGKDKLRGDDGNDVLNGGKQNDKLTGGSGKDSFVFSDKLGSHNVDTITDFSNGDVIDLDHSIFKGIGGGGTLKGKYFVVGNKAKDGNDHIIYKQGKGEVFYDKNGDKAGGMTLFAKVDKGTHLDHHDFLVM